MTHDNSEPDIPEDEEMNEAERRLEDEMSLKELLRNEFIRSAMPRLADTLSSVVDMVLPYSYEELEHQLDALGHVGGELSLQRAETQRRIYYALSLIEGETPRSEAHAAEPYDLSALESELQEIKQQLAQIWRASELLDVFERLISLLSDMNLIVHGYSAALEVVGEDSAELVDKIMTGEYTTPQDKEALIGFIEDSLLPLSIPESSEDLTRFIDRRTKIASNRQNLQEKLREGELSLLRWMAINIDNGFSQDELWMGLLDQALGHYKAISIGLYVFQSVRSAASRRDLIMGHCEAIGIPRETAIRLIEQTEFNGYIED